MWNLIDKNTLNKDNSEENKEKEDITLEEVDNLLDKLSSIGQGQGFSWIIQKTKRSKNSLRMSQSFRKYLGIPKWQTLRKFMTIRPQIGDAISIAIMMEISDDILAIDKKILKKKLIAYREDFILTLKECRFSIAEINYYVNKINKEIKRWNCSKEEVARVLMRLKRNNPFVWLRWRPLDTQRKLQKALLFVLYQEQTKIMERANLYRMEKDLNNSWKNKLEKINAMDVAFTIGQYALKNTWWHYWLGKNPFKFKTKKRNLKE